MDKLTQRLANLSPAKRQLMEQVLQRGKQVAEPIAICGMGCRFPGASNAAAYWQLLMRKEDAIQEIPSSRWDIDEFYDPTGEISGKMSTQWGGFLEHVDQFDSLFFNLSPREAEKIDPQQRLLLEVAWEALENGAIAPDELGSTKTGVFIGISGVDYSRIPSQLEDHYQQISVHSGTGNALSIAANRISYLLDLRGPSLSVDTACSSSLVALHLAVRSLRSRESDAALVGGVNHILTPETTVAFSRSKMLSPTGQCRPFDAMANGYVRSEGCGVVVLKRLSDAIAAGDRVLAVVRGSAVNQDGRTSGITAPNSLSQQAVLRAALAEAGLTSRQISYLEAHGTGTPLGDPIELEALSTLYVRKSPDDPLCHLGSVKANIGHTETAAGIASLIKVVLMLQHGQIPGQAHLEQLNPHITLQGTRLEISREPISWTTESSRLAGISAFGFGGTNAHVIVEEAQGAARNHTYPERPYHLVTLSGKTDTALTQLANRYGQFLDSHPDIPLVDLCHTASAGRTHFQHRVVIGADSTEQLRKHLEAFGRGESAPSVRQGVVGAARRAQVAWLFTGQGSQYVGMGRELFQTPGPFRETLTLCDQILRDVLDESLLELLHSDRHAGALDETIHTQPALFALDYALAKLWQSWGVEPEVLLGHSIGEYAAACFAGVFTLEEGLRLVAHRGRLMQQLPRDGLMAVVFAPLEPVQRTIAPHADRVSVAAHNGPENTVISGSARQVRELCDRFQQAGTPTQLLTVSHAFHSPLMDPILDQFEQLAEEIDYQVPQVPIVSNLTGQVMAEEAPDARYWRDHIRSTVLFAEGVRQLAACQPDAVVEMGPSATLLGMARCVSSELPVAWLPSLRKDQHDWRTLLSSLSELYVRGVQVDWRGLDRPWSRRAISLPTYPFQRRPMWYDLSHRRTQQLSGSGHGASVHPLLGWQVPAAVSHTIYESRLSPSWPSYLREHQVQGSVLVPAAAYLEQSLAAADQCFGQGPHVVENVAVQQALILTEENPRTVQLSMAPETSGRCALEIHSRKAEPDAAGDEWVLHACGTCRPVRDDEALHQPKKHPLAEIRERLVETNSGAETESREETKSKESFYREMGQHGLVYGPTFQVLGELARGEAETLAAVELPEQVLKQQAEYRLHPTLLDGCFQAMAGVVPRDPSGSDSPYTYVPTFIRRLRLHGQPAGPMWIHGVRTSAGDHPSPETVEGDVWLLDDSGEVIAELLGVRLQRLGRSGAGQSPIDCRDWSYRVRWNEASLLEPISRESTATATEPSVRLVFSDRGGIGDALAALPANRAAQYVLVYPGNEFRHEKHEETSAVDCYQIDPRSADDYRQLLDRLRQRISSHPCEVIHLWSCDLVCPTPSNDKIAAADPATMDDLLALSGQLGCGSVLPLIQQLARADFGQQISLTLVTRGAQALPDGSEENPIKRAEKAPRWPLPRPHLWGLGRVVAMELPDLQVRLVDLDPAAEPEAGASCLARELETQSPENQVAYRVTTRYVARLQRDPEGLSVPEEQVGSTSPPEGPFRLGLTTPGKFSALRYVPLTRKPPGPDQVELEVQSTGLNFSDVLKAMGLYPGIQDEIVPLGIECAGVVTTVGEGVSRFQVGDRVVGVAPYSFASHVVTAPYALVATPEQLSDDQACTIPITFLTAHYALCRLAHLQPGEKVLIHAAAGGVGQAAIQIAQAIGAEIFATAGSDEKRDFLRSLGIEHVMNSRTFDFAEAILEATDRRGVDCVLNSLPGEAIAKSLSVLAAYGRFLEIGKIDIYQNRMLGLLPFQDNLSYFAIDLDRLLRQRPQAIQEMFAQLLPFFQRGDYRPLPLTRFAADETVDAFRYMAQRRNIGKVVVSLRDRAHESRGLERPEQSIRAGATYLVTGGLGALGLRVAEWLSTQGATHIVLLSRRKPSAKVAQSLEKLQALETRIAVVTGDVTHADSLASALQQIPTPFPPLRGVFHAAGVLADRLLLAMDPDGLERAMAPKVQGAWNLHKALADVPLECFVLFSSVASLLGSPGQANYAAGNAFLDGLAHFRRQQGLAACSIQWGPWADAGMAASGGVEQQVVARGMQPMAPDRALAALEVIVAKKPVQAIVMDVRWDDLLSRFPGARPALLENFAQEETGPEDEGVADDRDEEFYQRLQQADADERTALLQTYIAETVASIMEVDLENLAVDQPLSALGLDSLMGMELKATLESQLGLNLPMSSLLDNPSVGKLAVLAGQALAGEIDATQESQASPHGKTEASASPPSSTASFSPLVALAPEGDHRPLFCIHPVGGDVRCYFELAKAIPDDWPVWALRPRGLDSLSGPHHSMDELANDYLRAIRQIQPSGSLNLLGWSTGGIFALAIAHRLQAQENGGCELVFLDTPTPAIFQKVDLNDDARFLYDLVNFSNWFAGTDMRVSYKQLRRQDLEASLRDVLQTAKEQGVLPEDTPVEHLRRIIEVSRENVRLLMQYEPKPLEHPVHLIRPRETGVLAEAASQSLEHDLGWGRIVGERLQLREVPGDHFSMMLGENARHVADVLVGCLG